MSDHLRVLLVGAGNMGREYAKVLNNLDVDLTVVGRDEKRCSVFKNKFNVDVASGGIQKYFDKDNLIFDKAIVAVNIDQLYLTVKILIKNGIKDILVEKPGAINKEEILDLADISEKYNVNIYVAYNRRFYSSVYNAEKIIKQDGGLTSIYYEFTEWASDIEGLPHSAEIKEEWLIANSSHVIDLGLFLGGEPVEWKAFATGSLSWHKRGAIYVGAGVTNKEVLFTYQANWDAPGRWGVELLTREHRLILRPLEKLSIQNRDSLLIEEVDLDDSLDKQYKPGVYLQTTAFLYGNDADRLLTIKQQAEHMKIYAAIENPT